MPQPTLSLQQIAEHHLAWNDRLQDWLDSEVEPADGDAFEMHLRDCVLCQQRLEEFSQLEDALIATNPAPHLSADFDARLMAQVDSVSEEQRRAARQQAEQELQQSLHALARSWRRTLTFVIAGVCGGVALALALAGYFEASGLTGRIAAQGASELGGNVGTLHVALTAFMGAAIGGALSGWLARSTA